jgi:hypothetical protein
VVAELSAILSFFTKKKLQNVSGTNAATCPLAADFPSLKLTLSVIQLSTVHFIAMEQHTLLSAYKNL